MKSISDEVYRRLVRELLGVVILLQLGKRSLSGYDVILFVYEKFHVLLSSGTVYSCLYALEREGFVKGQCGSKRRTYKLTEFGRREITEFQNSRAKISMLLLQILNC